jgi:DNA-binding NarL/FixJ family response regulator
MKKTALYLIDDHKIFLQSFQAYILTQPAFDWYGSNEGEDSAIPQIIQLDPDVVLLDFHLRATNGIEVLKNLRSADFKGKVIFLSMNRDLQVRKEVRSLGANGFVSKDVDGNILLSGILRLLDGTLSYLELPSGIGNLQENLFHFTPQEEVIARMICQGASSEEVAQKLFISIHTVHTHRRRILEKTNSENFIQVCQKTNYINR